jgi:hypothetical protein
MSKLRKKGRKKVIYDDTKGFRVNTQIVNTMTHGLVSVSEDGLIKRYKKRKKPLKR